MDPHFLQDFAYWKHLKITVADWEPGRATLHMQAGPEHLQLYAKVHGGAVASLVDCALGAAVRSYLGEGQGATTVELKVNYLRPALPGRLRAEAVVHHRGRTTAFGTVEVYGEDGRLVAYGTSTYMLLGEDRLKA